MRWSQLRPSPAMVVAMIALFVSLGGVGVAATKIGTKNLRNGAVTSAKLHNGAVSGVKIRNGAVKRGKIAKGAINRIKIAADAVGPAELADGSVQTTKLADGAVTIGKLADASVSTAKLDLNAVTTEKIAAGSVTTGRLADGAVRASALGPVVEHTSETTVPDNAAGTATVACAAGQRMIGGGGFWTASTVGDKRLVASFGVPGTNSWVAVGRNMSGADATLHAQVLCLEGGFGG